MKIILKNIIEIITWLLAGRLSPYEENRVMLGT